MSYIRLSLLVSSVALLGCPKDEPQPTERTLIILHSNDEHSHVLGAGPELDDYPAPTTPGTGTVKGGLARRASVIKTEKDAATAAGAEVLTLSGGDNSMGTLMQVNFATSGGDFALMKQIGYDATTLGNHEFDFGPKALASAIKAAQAGGGVPHIVATTVQFHGGGDEDLSAIFDESGTDASKFLHRTWTITTPSGLKVGLVGTMGAIAATYAPLKGPVTVSLPPGATENDIDRVKTQMYADLQKYVDKLRNEQNVDLVVLMSHSGVDMNNMTKGEDYQIATNVNGIDVIVSGHTHSEFPRVEVMNTHTNKKVLIQQAGYYGSFLGKMVIKVGADGAVSFDMANSRLIPINDTIVASDANVNMLVDNVIKDLESRKLAGGKSFLEQTISAMEGRPVTDDPGQVGDLFFRKVGQTAFNLQGIKTYRETPVMVLTADAELAEADKAGPTDIAVTVQGVMRADIDKGKTGAISFADVFRILPLGISPVDGSIGYGLTRFAVFAAELKGALEISCGFAYDNDDRSSYFMTVAGAKVEYDTSRTAFNAMVNPIDPTNGRITKITLATSHANLENYDKVIFDVGQGGWTNGVGVLDPFVITTSYYIAAYAKVNGVQLKSAADPNMAVTPEGAIIKRQDGSEVKEWEALGAYIKAQTTAGGGTLPARYDASASMYPRRMICSGPLCNKQ